MCQGIILIHFILIIGRLISNYLPTSLIWPTDIHYLSSFEACQLILPYMWKFLPGEKFRAVGEKFFTIFCTVKIGHFPQVKVLCVFSLT